ncbi:MAG: hypothetical protein ABIS86_05885 [Streptosporangiaceae bacterium]
MSETFFSDSSQHCILLTIDVADFTAPDRHDGIQLEIHDVLYALVKRAFQDSELDWASCLHEDRGDGMVILIPARISSVKVVDPLLTNLQEGLQKHNLNSDRHRAFKLRAAVHIGEVHQDAHGLVGTSVNDLFRLVAAPVLKAALANADGDLALIVSDYFYDSVLRHSSVGPFHQVRVRVKQTRARGWIHLPGSDWRLEPLGAGGRAERA